MPVLYSLLLSDSSFDDLMSVIREENGFLLLIPLTVVLAANLFFEEHDYDTLKNLMCVPVTKGRLTMAKLFVLLIFDIAYEAAGYYDRGCDVCDIRNPSGGSRTAADSYPGYRSAFMGCVHALHFLLWCGVTNPILFQ